MENPEAAVVAAANGNSSASNPSVACLGGFRKGARRLCDSEEKPLSDSQAAGEERPPRPRSPQPPARLSSSGSEEAVPDHPEGPQHLPPPPPPLPHRRPHHHHHHHHRRHHSPLNASPPQRRRRRRSNHLLLLDPGGAALMDAGGAAGLLYPPLGRLEDGVEEEDDDDDDENEDDEDDDELDEAGDEEGAGDLASSESAGSGFSTQGCVPAERRKRARGSGSGLSGGGNSASSCISRNYEVVRELGAEEVRWFYREDRKSWKPFIGYDSLRMELAYRALLLPDGQGSSSPTTGRPEKLAPSSSIPTPEPVCVRGGLYEVDVANSECYPVYWNQSEKIPVMRGQWFIDGTWQPLEEEESNLIEEEHLRCFKGQQMQNFDTNVSKPIDRKEAVHSLKLSRNHVDWHSVDEVYLYSDATTSKIARTVSQKLGFSKASSSGTRLHRGYVEEATLEDKPSPTTHIVFVVHGIGQKIEQGRIIRNTAMMRETARKIEEKYFSNLATHVEFLPVEWRSKLTLDGDTVDSITPDKVRGLRDLLNSSAMDIMYYTSPLYRDELVKGLQQEMNRLYTLFCSRNPEFTEKDGKVSIVSHSLGCVITYDIMTGWNPVRLYEQLLEKEYDVLEHSWMTYEEQRLLEEFYLTKKQLREIEDRLHGLKTSTVAKTPALKFKAYRLEPLILKHYSNISPVQIHWYNTTNPLPYEHMKPSFLNPAKESTSVSDPESLTTLPSPTTSPVMSRRHYGESITNIGKASILGAASIGKGLGGMLFSRFGRSSLPTSQVPEPGKEGTEVEDKKSVLGQTSVGTQTFPHSSSGFLDPTIELDHRIDFELREGLVESRYWSAVTSHTAYWSSMDVALFLLTFMYKQDQEEDDIKPHLDPV
uniref:DDHD domain containing 1 n=1 Tax=Naja naja TaxID=35670 RepID=A0A8C6X8F5_NAJNA